MNKSLNVVLLSGMLSMIGLAGCGSIDQASGPVETLQPVGPREYATIPPVSAPPTTAPPAQPQPGQVTTIETVHVVAANESLPMIAAAYQVDLAELAAYNGLQENHVVNLGDRIRIPVGATMPTGPIGATSGGSDGSGSQGGDSGSEGTGDSGEQDGNGCTYTIAPGDNPTKVANKVGISVTELQEANASSGVLANFLVGDKLVIPAPGSC